MGQARQCLPRVQASYADLSQVRVCDAVDKALSISASVYQSWVALQTPACDDGFGLTLSDA